MITAAKEENRDGVVNGIILLLANIFKGVGTGPADPATAGPKFPVHQASPQ